MRPDAVSRTNCTPGLTRRAGGQEQPGWLEAISSEADPPHTKLADRPLNSRHVIVLDRRR
jgi:hypothetical protein